MSKFRLEVLALFLLSIAGGAQGFAGHPITLNISQSYLDSLPPENRQVLKAITDALNKRGLESQSDYKVVMPESKVEALDGQIIQLHDLFKEPTDSNESPSLAKDENGNQLHLSKDQLALFKKEAVIKVASKKFPGKYHVWQINTLLQEGSDHIQVTFEEGASSSLGHVLVEIPSNFFSTDADHWSVRKSVTHAAYGLRGLISNIVGLIEEKPKYTAETVSRLLEKKKREFVAQNLANASLGTSSTGQPVKFDGRLYDEKLAHQVQAQVKRIQNEHSAEVRAQEAAWQKDLLKELRRQFPEINRGNLQILIDKQIAERQFEALNNRLRQDAQLESVAPGYGALLANQRTAVRVTEEIEASLQQEVAEKELEIRGNYREKHSVLARIGGWLEPRVEAKKEAFYRRIRWDRLGQIGDRLDEMGLHQEAAIAREILKFQSEQEEHSKAELSAQTEPANKTQFETRIWQSKDWIKKESKDNNGAFDGYYPEKYRTSEISTDQLLWRWRIAGQRTQTYFKNGLYGIMVSNLWNGPVGLRALVSTQPQICTDQKMDPKTGAITNDPEASCSTFYGNLKGIQDDYHQARYQFEAAPDEGLLGKGFSRPFHVTYQWMKRGLSTLVVGVGQPVLTACNATFSCLAAASSPVWAPISSVFMLGLDSTVYDVDYPGSTETVGHPSHQAFPLLQYTVGDIGIGGVAQATASVVKTAAYDTPAFFVKGSYAFARKAARTTYDAVLRGIVGSRLTIPGVNTFWASRKQGPGLASSYYFQVSPEVAILALQAVLEQDELRLFKASEQAKIDKPVQDFYAFFAQIARPLTVNGSSLPEAHALEDEQRKNNDSLDKAVGDRQQHLSSVSTLPSWTDRSLVKLTQESLAKTLKVSEQVVSSFYNERLLKRLTHESRVAFWQTKDLDEGDFEGLTRYYYANAFDNDFLIPLQTKDLDFVIPVNQPSLGDIFAHFPLH